MMKYSAVYILTIKEKDKEIILSPKGGTRLDYRFFKIFQDYLNGLVRIKNKHIVFDLNNILFIDSYGFNIIQSLSMETKQNHSGFILKNINPELMELIRLLSLDNIFDIHFSVIRKRQLAVAS